MIKYSILIIDDDWEIRKKDYELLLGKELFDFEYIKSGNDLGSIKNKTPHAFILDMDLSKWVTRPMTREKLFNMTAEFIGNNAPVFLVSSKWSSHVVTWLNESKDIKVLSFFSWNHDVKGVLKKMNPKILNPTRLKIKGDLDNYYQRDRKVIGPEENVILLDISDLQFGDPDFSNDAAMLEGLLPKFLRQKNITIDLLLITGDVTYQGFPEEFKETHRWVNDLCKELFSTEQNYRSRILLVPGNHDVNLKLSAADGYDYDFSKRKVVKRKKSEVQHKPFGLVPFRQFAFNLTSNINWATDQNELFMHDDRFLHWGVRFYFLNTVCEQTFELPDKRSTPLKYLSRLRTAPRVPDDIFKIVVSHHGPQHLGFDLDSSRAEWRELRNFLETIGANLFLFGHTHKTLTYKLPDLGDSVKKINYHMAATLTLDKKLRGDDSRRGFSVIELRRKNGIVKKAYIRTFEIDGAKARETTKD